MESASKIASKMRGRPFPKGHPGGPGRPAGSRNGASLLLDAMADNSAPEVLTTVVDAAKAGDLRACELLLSRVWPVRKGRPVALDLPAINTAADLVAVLGSIAGAMARGVITPDEAQAVSAVLETKRRAIETVELEARIAALEQERR
jgi:hypothetical protein